MALLEQGSDGLLREQSLGLVETCSFSIAAPTKQGITKMSENLVIGQGCVQTIVLWDFRMFIHKVYLSKDI